MTSVTYRYVEPFVVTGADGVERERVPVKIFSRKWQHLSGSLYRVWFRLVVTDFGAALVGGTLDESRVTYPEWFDAEALNRIAEWVQYIRSTSMPAAAVDEVIGGGALAQVEAIEADGDALNVTVRIDAPVLPVTAEVGPATATFDPRGE